MNELTPVFDKIPKFFDGQDTITSMNRARTWNERIKESKERYEKNKAQKGEVEEKSIQEILYGIKEDMGEKIESKDESRNEDIER